MPLLRAPASTLRRLCVTSRRYVRCLTSSPPGATSRRVIGIIAHIDAGKTTTTERFLFAASARRHLGDVDSGDTTTDFLPEEIRRGITIKAAVTHCVYRGVNVDIVDTPGHVDFGVEVVSSLRAVDGAVMILDAVRGVEAQTRTVYRHADEYALPVVAVINKCDRDGADIDKTLAALSRTFRRQFLLLHIPVLDEQAAFVGAVDALSGDEYRWNSDWTLPPAKRLANFTKTAVDCRHSYAQRLSEHRDRVLEILAEFDDDIMRTFLEAKATEWDARMIDKVRMLIRSLTCSRRIVPVLIMSAKQCIGIQPLLDAVIDFLPAPNQAPPFKVKHALIDNSKRSQVLARAAASEERRISSSAPLLVFVFKTAFDITRGGAAVPISHIRVCGGVLHANDILINTRNGARERPIKVVTIDGASVKDVETVAAGEVAALIGLKETDTADTLCRYNDKEPVRMSGISSGASVFFLNVTAERHDDDPRLRQALAALCREDPSLSVRNAEDGSGALTVGGFGELHLEVTVNRLRNDFKLAVSASDIAVNFAETVQHNMTVATANTLSAPNDADVRARLASAVAIRVTLQPMAEGAMDDDGEAGSEARENLIIMESAAAMPAADVAALLAVIDWSGQAESSAMTALFAAAIHDGIAAELSRGPLFALSIQQTAVRLDSYFISAAATPHAVKMAAVNAVKSALTQTENFAVIEPIMRVVVSARREHVGAVANDLSAIRRAHISNIDNESTDEMAEVVADVPLMEMLGYASALRSLTGGNANFSMSAQSYAILPRSKYKAIRRY